MDNDLKRLLVHVDASARAHARIELAVALAQQHSAELIGIHLDTFRPVVPAGATDLPAQVIEEIHAAYQQEQTDLAQRFDRAMRQSGVQDYRWKALRGYPLHAAGEASQSADLIIVGQSEPGVASGLQPENFPSALVLESATPVLVVPYAGEYAHAPERALIAWDGRREAARAVKDALPFLGRAKSVRILCYANKDNVTSLTASTAELESYLHRRGIKTGLDIGVQNGIDAGEWLLSRAADHGGDLLIMGGYGHSRLREIVMGGVTRTILREMTLPTLLSH
jgi:nucleotide-binding universal stress UspA family protein